MARVFVHQAGRQRWAPAVSMVPPWCAPSLASVSHPSSSPGCAACSPRKVSHCHDDFSRGEAGRPEGEEVSCEQRCAWEPGARLALHNGEGGSFPEAPSQGSGARQLPLPSQPGRVRCPDGAEKRPSEAAGEPALNHRERTR